MGAPVEKVKKAIEVGVSVSLAIRNALDDRGLNASAFAEKYELPRARTSSQLATTTVADEPLIRALIAELGGTVEEWVEVLTIRPKIALEKVG